MRSRLLLIIALSLSFISTSFYIESKEEIKAVSHPVSIDIDAAKDGPIYGDEEGLQRVKKLEAQLHAMKIREDHPRIFLTKENLPMYRARALDKRLKYNVMDQIIEAADKGDPLYLAFLYLIYQGSDDRTSEQAGIKAADKIVIGLGELESQDKPRGQDIAKLALAFDWAYDAMTAEQRKYVVDKLSKLTGIDETAKKIKDGLKIKGETFHREEWAFHSYICWPEIALAYHNPNAELVYKARWNYDWYWGDAARMYAYAADGTPFEGYYYGADGGEWFVALRSATGINLIDGEFGWCKGTAKQVLYRLDMDRGREMFHHGVGLGGAGVVAYKEGSVAWKVKKFFGRSLMYGGDNPYIKWTINEQVGWSDWILTMRDYDSVDGIMPLAIFLYDDPEIGPLPISQASYDEMPLGIHFPGGNEAYMRTGWLNAPACAGFRSSPAYTKTSHGDFDVNTFVIYKEGVLSPDSGVYDVYSGQGNYFRYQKNTVAHNDILVVNPIFPDEPKKLTGGTPDPGGVERVFTRTFGAPSRFGIDDVFLHNRTANWADIIDFRTTPEYDYVIGEAAKAYYTRVDEYYRTLVFIRKGNSAYVVIFDRVEAKSPDYIKKSLIHTVTMPEMNGKIIQTKVPGHYEIFDADYFESKNIFDTSKMCVKVLLPYEKKLSRIGGEGYDFYVEGSKPKNYPVPEKEQKRIEERTMSPWQEAGQWRVEIISDKKQKRDYFMQVIYVTDKEDNSFDPGNVTLEDKGDKFAAVIKDDILGEVRVSFTKTGKPIVQVENKDQLKSQK